MKAYLVVFYWEIFPFLLPPGIGKEWKISLLERCMYVDSLVRQCCLTCCTEEEGEDWHDAHIADRRLECECEDSEGDPSVLYGCLQRDGDDL